MKALITRRNHPALLRMVLLLALFAVCCVWVVWAWREPWWQLLLSQLVFGTLACSTFAAEHETVHGTAFRSRPLNRAFALILGIAHVYPSSIFRELHFTHHRHTHVPGLDPEISLGGKPAPNTLGSLPFYLGWLSGFPLLGFKLGMIVMGAIGMPEPVRKRLYPFIRPGVRTKVVGESILVLGVHLGVTALAIFHDPAFWALWIGQLVGHCFLAAYLVMEHNGLPHEGNILDKTRSIRANLFLRTVMWNMPYHAEHHAYPAVPFHALPELHARMAGELKHREGHLTFNGQLLRRFLGVKKLS